MISQLRGRMALACWLSIFFAGSVWADVRLPALFADKMVLQRDAEVPIWGWAEAGEEVHIAIGNELTKTKANDKGKWRADLPAHVAGGPHKIVIEGRDSRREINDVYFGEVWICSGQSNMQFPVSSVTNAKSEIAAADFPLVRMFTVPRKPAMTPQDDCEGKWQTAQPETVGGFSAVGYFFARKLHKELGVPIGMLHTSWGGTLAEVWTSREALEKEESLRPILERALPDKPHHNSAANLYNGMLVPLIPFRIRGAIWYQGESNVGRAEQYATLFPTMINDWRTRFESGDFSFLFVQLAPFRYGNHDPELCAELWDAQFKTLRGLPNMGMAVTTDITTLKNIHPPNKQDVGRRLALWALAKDYGRDDLVYSGPLYKDQTQGEGGKIVVRFDDVGTGLKTRDGDPLSEFTIAGPDKHFVPAQAKIVGGDRVVVWSKKVSNPVAVRMGWRDTAQPNLVNREGLPASPFRTDDWPLKTAGKR